MLRSHLFANNHRLNAAANNNPIMRRGDPDADAVRLLQQALRDLEAASMRRSIQPDGMFDGDFAGETTRALQTYQRNNSIGGPTGTGNGQADRETLMLMDGQLASRGIVPLTLETAAAAPPPVETPAMLGRGIPKLPTGSRLRLEYDLSLIHI